MFWFALILAVIVGAISGIAKNDADHGFRTGLITLGIGVVVSLLLVYSGLMGG